MRRPILMLLGLCAATAHAFSQDLTGTWEGTEEGNYMKLVIVKVGNQYVGYTYDTDPGGGWCRANFRGSFNAGPKELHGFGDGMIAKRGSHVQCTYELTFFSGRNGDRLSGTERTKGNPKPLFGFLDFDEGPVELRRVSRTVDTTAYMRRYLPPPPVTVVPRSAPPTAQPPAKTPAVAAKPPAARPRTTPPVTTVRPRPATPRPAAPKRTVPPAPRRGDSLVTIRKAPPKTPALPAPARPVPANSLLRLKTGRSNNVVQEISTSVRSITIRVFDNGVPDGDTVSILHNNEVVFDHKLVAVQSFSFTVQLDEGDPVHDITLIAHNVGSIPPNTASIVVEAGDERYRLTASTDLQRNAVIRIRYTP
ncbi:hypothetical protein [Flaviaesturariibacter aridisoli]|uniref:DUF2147 domain-containing protein n=1 Tax=Flaviaesturariibacter aridisoli TaxID=2545761 RepID=A0A4R4E4D2_9BACT|nr:hypothetical protein [Flaviaesturariibacter aridisoli]TCZ71780.1 hypothetical protein E0486_09525 [Flaviaesturariibacter aridisoli]